MARARGAPAAVARPEGGASPEVLAAFSRATFFAALPELTQLALARRTSVVTLSAHDVLWREGDEGTHVGLVLHGRVAIERAVHRRLMIDVMGPGALLGEVAFSLGGPYQFDVRCLRKARVALVPAGELRSALGSEPRLGLAFASALADEVLRLTRRLEALSAGTVSQRLARVLVTLTERFGMPFPGGTLMPARVRREDLAALAATTLESASRQISAWRRQGVLVPQPSGFVVTDIRRLKALCDAPAS